jgi:DNA ligase-1
LTSRCEIAQEFSTICLHNPTLLTTETRRHGEDQLRDQAIKEHLHSVLNVGKAYSGLTDVEIAEMTKWFLDHTIDDHGFRRTVDPKIVLEVAFNNVMKSDRHASGYALRFPRIVRLRPDKLPEEVDTLSRVTEIYEQQNR